MEMKQVVMSWSQGENWDTFCLEVDAEHVSRLCEVGQAGINHMLSLNNSVHPSRAVASVAFHLSEQMWKAPKDYKLDRVNVKLCADGIVLIEVFIAWSGDPYLGLFRR